MAIRNNISPAVSGRTKGKRPVPPINGTPVYAPKPPPGQYVDPNGVLRNADGSRAVSGKTKAARGAAAGTTTTGGGTTTTTGGGTTTTTGGGGDTGGVSYNADGSRVVSGKTKAARANTELIATIEKYFLVGAVIVGSIYVVRHFHLLSGGNAGNGNGGGGGGGNYGGGDYVPRHPHTGRFRKGG